MRKIESIEDEANGVVTIELPDGRRVCIPVQEFQMDGFRGVARRHCGGKLDDRRINVVQDGRDHVVGTLPIYFNPDHDRSSSMMYQARPGDFVRDGDVWVAHKSLGPGDLMAVPGFRPINPAMHRTREVSDRAVMRAVATEINS